VPEATHSPVGGRALTVPESAPGVEPRSLRNRIVFQLTGRGWVSIDDLAAILDVAVRSLVRPLVQLRRDGHVEADGEGRVRFVPAWRAGS
jgi:predicted Rossmann fold nucleotide-binding protein DprA/Smf involved in DNA uptake